MLALVTISEDPALAKGQIRMLLETVVRTNQLLLLEHDVPSLYESGVRYRAEPWHAHAQSFSDVQEVIGRGWGCCKALSAWLCAEYRNAAPPDLRDRIGLHVSYRPYGPGEQPKGFRLVPRNGRTGLFHVRVQLPDGSLEDPTTKVPPWET